MATAVQHLNIDYAVEGRHDFNRQIGSVNGVELPIEELAAELAVNEGSDV